jgi:branched-subunit amino acid permease
VVRVVVVVVVVVVVGCIRGVPRVATCAYTCA